MSASIPWPEVDITRLKQCVDQGMSANDVALEMSLLSDGRKISRSSVIGKMRRLRLRSHIPPSISSHVTVRKPRPSRAKIAKPKAQPSAPNPVSLIDVKENQCRWPVTAVVPIEDFRFCGARKLEGCSYCEMHREMAVGNGTESERRAT